MKVLVTGREGQLARSLAEIADLGAGLTLLFAGRPDLDLAVRGSASRAIRELAPDAIVNAAAFTAVDQAERESRLAYEVNAIGAEEVAAAAAEAGAPVIQLSTDYVFDGNAAEPYREDATARPINVYGASKLAGEERVRAVNPRHLILRTSWVFSPFGSNFVKTMLRLAEAHDEVRVVSDQFGCPTSAPNLAATIVEILRRWSAGQTDGQGGTYHLAGRGSCSWAEFAAEIFAASREIGGPAADVIPISTDEYPTAARRPKNSVLDSAKFAHEFGLALPWWKTSARSVVEKLVTRVT